MSVQYAIDRGNFLKRILFCLIRDNGARLAVTMFPKNHVEDQDRHAIPGSLNDVPDA